MICPLLTSGQLSANTMAHGHDGDCQREGCAWWSPTEKRCAVLSAAVHLNHIVMGLDDIHNDIRKGQ